MAADMDWMAERAAERLDPRQLLPGAQTVVALACNYHVEAPWAERLAAGSLRPRARLPRHAARPAPGQLRRTLREAYPGVADFASVDHAPLMEKVWASRAGLGYVARNGCLVTPQYGSWVVLAAMVLDRAVDSGAYAEGPADDRCGRCRLCVDACPTAALDGLGGVDARACLSYQTIENEGAVPVDLRSAFEGTVFGCDVCQSVCPLNQAPVPTANARFCAPAGGPPGRPGAGCDSPAKPTRPWCPGRPWPVPASMGCGAMPPMRWALPATAGPAASWKPCARMRARWCRKRRAGPSGGSPGEARQRGAARLPFGGGAHGGARRVERAHLPHRQAGPGGAASADGAVVAAPGECQHFRAGPRPAAPSAPAAPGRVGPGGGAWPSVRPAQPGAVSAGDAHQQRGPRGAHLLPHPAGGVPGGTGPRARARALDGHLRHPHGVVRGAGAAIGPRAEGALRPLSGGRPSARLALGVGVLHHRRPDAGGSRGAAAHQWLVEPGRRPVSACRSAPG